MEITLNNAFRGVKPNGRLGDTAEAQVQDMIEAHKPDLSEYATKLELAANAPTSEAVAQALGYALVVGKTEPEPTRHGVPVIWFDTRNQSAWAPTAPVIDDKAKTVTIPADEGATYRLNGEVKTAGTYPFTPEGSPIRITVVASAKAGYTLAGQTKWEGVITAGWKLLGTDALTSGAWDVARSPFGAPYASATGTPLISAQGASTEAHGAYGELIATFDTRRTAMRLSIDYDISSSVSGSKPVLELGVGYASVAYADRTHSKVTLTNIKGAVSIAASGAARDPFTVTPTGETIPTTGTLVVEAIGTNLRALVGGVVVAAGTLPGPANGMRAQLKINNNKTVAKNWKIEVQ